MSWLDGFTRKLNAKSRVPGPAMGNRRSYKGLRTQFNMCLCGLYLRDTRVTLVVWDILGFVPKSP